MVNYADIANHISTATSPPTPPLFGVSLAWSRVMPEPRIVYVIDDEKAVRDSVAFLLEARELCVQGFPSAGEFLAAAPSLAPGCVLTDVQMPGMDGLELLRDIRGRNLLWPVVVMTAHGEVPLAVQALKAGAS